MKTGVEFLVEMPYKYQVLFLKRYTRYNRRGETISSMLLETYGTHMEFITSGFIWMATPEGHDYWRSISMFTFETKHDENKFRMVNGNAI